MYKKKARGVFCCCVWRIKATRINSGFVTQLGLFFSFASTLILTHYDANLFFQNWKTQTGLDASEYSQIFEEFWDDTTRFQVFVGFFFSFGIDSRKKIVHKQERKKKRPDERNTRIIMPRKEEWFFFSYVRHFPPKSLKGITQWKHYTIVYERKASSLDLLIFVLKNPTPAAIIIIVIKSTHLSKTTRKDK